MKPFLLLILVLLLTTTATAAQEPLAPPEIPGEAVYIPFPVPISLDGKLDDWAGVPVTLVERGPQTSADPAENGSLSVSAAADTNNLYILMTMPDQNIITGQHGRDFWNEDSMEFFLNLSGDLAATKYSNDIFQININPSDLGNTDPKAITVTGTNSDKSSVQAVVFKTEAGWGFEAALPLADRLTPEHGLEIGFQAQANGASTKDRDVKLIWSNADTKDQSWQNPSLFGRGIFFEIGQKDIPMPSTTTTVAAEPTPAPATPTVIINQTGYFPSAAKYGMLPAASDQGAAWLLKDANTGKIVAEGTTPPGTFDAASGDTLWVADFSEVTTPGTYILTINNTQSAPFEIGDTLYSQLKNDAVRYFYLNRSGIELEKQYAGDWARPAGHLTDDAVTCYEGTDADGKTWDGCDYTLNARGGWYDAGDYGKYVVNGGIATWTLQNLYERLPEAYPDGSLNIPESSNGFPDILDEARWEMEFLLAMQVPEGQPLAGMVHHKLHALQWDGMPALPPTNTSDRLLFPPSTAATLNLAATAAQCARIWKEFDSDFAARCLKAAETAWQAATANPNLLAGNTPGTGGGNYNDTKVADEFFWAAAELFITTGQTEYQDFVTSAPAFNKFLGLDPKAASAMGWGDTAALGTISLAMLPNDLTNDDIEALRDQIVKTADRYLETMRQEGYHVSLSMNNYYWGSTSSVLNNALILALAYDFTDDTRYLNGVSESMDYLLGRNALNMSLVSGYGANSAQHPHHRFWANEPDNGFPPPPPGAVMGGPNGQPSDQAALDSGVMELAPAKRYVDQIGSYSTNEVAINWNAPLVWVTAYLDAHFSD